MYYKRVQLVIVCGLFVSQLVLSLFCNSNHDSLWNLLSSGSDGCRYFKWLWCWTRIIFPSINTFTFIAWLYILFMCPECFSNRFLYQLVPTYGFPFLFAVASPYFAFNTRSFSNRYIDYLFHHSLFSLVLYLIPSVILSCLILVNKSCIIPSSRCWALLWTILIQTIFIFDLTYIRMKHVIQNITIFHDHFLGLSLVMEILIVYFIIFVFGFIDWDNKLTALDQALLYIFVGNWIITIPGAFPYFYKTYYYQSIHPLNAAVSKWSVFYRVTMGLTTERIMNRLYAMIHVACHASNSYDILYSINSASASLPLLSNHNHELTNFASSKYGIVKHTQFGRDRFLCLQYQCAFMKLTVKEKINYISEIAPYSSPWLKLPFRLKFNALWYLWIFARVIGGTFPLFAFLYIYLYVINGDKLRNEGRDWLSDPSNKYEHFVVVFGTCVYFILSWVWTMCAMKIASSEYYYGFVRALLINDNTLFLGVESFHEWMLNSFEIVTILEDYTVTHIAIEIVSYCSNE